MDMWKVSTVKFATSAWNEHWFSGLEEARQIVEQWRQDYNEQRPHSALRQSNTAGGCPDRRESPLRGLRG